VDNCQSGVFLSYASDRGYGVLDQRLYMPKDWFTDQYAERARRCRVPEDLEFMSKTEIACELLKRTEERGVFSAEWIGLDTTFARDQAFLDDIGTRYWYMASVDADTRIWPKKPEVKTPPWKGWGRPPKARPTTPAVRVDEFVNSPDIEWYTARLNDGAKGPIVTHMAFTRVYNSRGKYPGDEVWLIIREYENGRYRYLMSNAPADTPLEELLKRSVQRWTIEQGLQEGKSDLGMADYEVRSWDGWHRHMAYVAVARLFLLELQSLFQTADGKALLTVPALHKLAAEELDKDWPKPSILSRLRYWKSRYTASYRSRVKQKESLLARLGLNRPFSCVLAGNLRGATAAVT